MLYRLNLILAASGLTKYGYINVFFSPSNVEDPKSSSAETVFTIDAKEFTNNFLYKHYLNSQKKIGSLTMTQMKNNMTYNRVI